MEVFLVESDDKKIPFLGASNEAEAIAFAFTNFPEHFIDYVSFQSKKPFRVSTAYIINQDDIFKMELLKSEVEARNWFYRDSNFKATLDSSLKGTYDGNDTKPFIAAVTKSLMAMDKGANSVYDNAIPISSLEIADFNVQREIKVEAVWAVINTIYVKPFEGKTKAGIYLDQFVLNLLALFASQEDLIITEVTKPKPEKVRMPASQFSFDTPSGNTVIMDNANIFQPSFTFFQEPSPAPNNMSRIEEPVLRNANNAYPYPGWQNRRNSCFMHSTLAAMFLTQGSPFIRDILENEDLPSLANPKIASLINTLRMEVEAVRNGSNQECYDFRKQFAEYMPNPEEFMNNPEDPHLFYTIFCEVVGYNALSFKENSYRAQSEDGRGERMTEGALQRSTELPPLQTTNQNFDRVQYPDSWSEDYGLLQDSGDDYTWRKTALVIEEAKAVVVHVNRGILEPEFIVNDYVPSGVDAVNNKGIVVDTRIIVDGKNYDLSACVYPPNAGHYVCLIRDGKVWYRYNDLNAGNSNNQIGTNILSHYEAMQIIQTSGNLLFYYPKIAARDNREGSDGEFGLDFEDLGRNLFERMAYDGQLSAKDIVAACGTSSTVRSWCTEDFYRRQHLNRGLLKVRRSWRDSFIQNEKPTTLRKINEPFKSVSQPVHIWDRSFSYNFKTLQLADKNFMISNKLAKNDSGILFKDMVYLRSITKFLGLDYDGNIYLIVSEEKGSVKLELIPQEVKFETLQILIDSSEIAVLKDQDNEHYKFSTLTLKPEKLGIKTEKVIYLDSYRKTVAGLDEKDRFFYASYPRGQKSFPYGNRPFSYAYYERVDLDSGLFYKVILQDYESKVITQRILNEDMKVVEEFKIEGYNSKVKELRVDGEETGLSADDIVFVIFEDGTSWWSEYIFKPEKVAQYQSLFMIDYNSDTILAKDFYEP